MIKKITVFMLALFFVVTLVGCNSQQSKDNSKIKGNYFRQIYGSVGISEDSYSTNYLLNAELYSFNDNVDFLKNKDNIKFNDTDVNIENITYEKERTEKDLTIYHIVLDISFEKQGNYNISSLLCFNDNNYNSYSLGNISFNCKKGKNISLKHSCDTNTYNNNAHYYFIKNNKEPFTICDLITDNNGEYFSCDYKKNVNFTPNKQLNYNVKINTPVSKEDTFIFQPIFKIKMENSNEIGYFTPEVPVCENDNMNYSQIKQYVQKQK